MDIKKRYENILGLNVSKFEGLPAGRYLYSEFIVNFNEEHAKVINDLSITKRTQNHLTYRVEEDKIVLQIHSLVPAGVSATFAKEFKTGTLHEDLVDIQFKGDARISAQYIQNATFKITDYIPVEENLVHPCFEYPEAVYVDILDLLLLIGNIDLIHGFEEGLLLGPKEVVINE